MNNRVKRITLILLAVTWLYLPGRSQDGNPLQFIPGLSQSSLSNPAFQNKTDKLVVGLPFVSGVWMDWNANFSLDILFSQQFAYNLDRFYRELGEPGNELGTVQVPILYLSWKTNDQNFTFSVSDRFFSESNFDHEVLKFLDLGLAPFYGNDADYGPVNIRAFHYRELAFTWSKQVREGFSFGIRPKVLFGRLNYDLTGMHFNVHTDLKNEQLVITPTGKMNLAGPLEITYDTTLNVTNIHSNPDIADYFFNFRNLGVAADLGLTYQIQNTTFSASVTDLGFLTFKHKIYDIRFTDVLRFEHENLYQSNDPEGENYKKPDIALQELLDLIPKTFTVEHGTQRLFEPVPLKIYANVKQQISLKTDIGFGGQLTYAKGNSQNYLSGLMHTLLGERFDLAASVSLLDFKNILPGIGATYTGESAQIYLSTNNITALVKPSSAKYLNLCFGVNFLFSTR